jgi:hypothetical protein
MDQYLKCSVLSAMKEGGTLEKRYKTEPWRVMGDFS